MILLLLYSLSFLTFLEKYSKRKSSHWKTFPKIGVPKSLLKIHEKYLWRKSYFDKVADCRAVALVKTNSVIGIFKEF